MKSLLTMKKIRFKKLEHKERRALKCESLDC